MLKIYLADNVIKVPLEENDAKEIAKIQNKNIGFRVGNTYALKPYEALYLMYYNRAVLFKEKRMLSFEEGLNELSLLDKKVWVRFILFNDLQKRGYSVKRFLEEKISFFVSIKKGEASPEEYIFQAVLEGEPLTFEDLKKLAKEAIRLRKKIVLALIDKEGNITYYTFSYSTH